MTTPVKTPLLTEVEQKALDQIKLDEANALEYAKKKAEAKARIVEVFDRGHTNQRLRVDLPDTVHGEWVVNDVMAIKRMEMMGFEVDEIYSKSNSVHGSNKIGDLIYMTCPKYNKEAIDEVQQERFEATHGNPKKGKLPREEQEFKTNSALPVVNESSQTNVNADQIRAALAGAKT